MLFNSFEFAVFLGVVYILHILYPGGRRHIFLLASYVFYAYSSLAHLALLLTITAIAFGLAWLLAYQKQRWLLFVGALLILAPLLVFKYLSFVGGLVMGKGTMFPFNLLLPVGISFYTLQALSYVFDVFQGNAEPERDPVKVALYLSFFPQILAGPIERARRLMPQLTNFRTISSEEGFVALKTLLWGYFCKLVIADKLAQICEPILDSPEMHSSAASWLALVLYSFRIYFDFYAYSLIAVGLGRLFGIKLSRNFNHPYLAVSFQDFWRRWHITLSSWFKDYLYVPLGGNRHGSVPFVGTVFAVFCLSGLWHGAEWSFVVWGALHACLYLGDRATHGLRDAAACRLRLEGTWVQAVVSRLTVFGLVSFLWVFFRASDLNEAIAIFAKLISGESFFGDGSTLLASWDLFFILIAVLFFTLDCFGEIEIMIEAIPNGWKQVFREVTLVNVMVVLCILTGDVGTREFVYFRF